MRLKNRQHAVPGGFAYVWAATKYDLQRAMPHRSFSDACNALFAHIKANPHHAAQSQMPTDIAGVERIVEEFTCAVLKKSGYTDFIMEDVPVNPQTRLHQTFQPLPPSSRNAAVGAKTISGIKTYIEWIGDGGVPVAKELAEQRGTVCVSGDGGAPCPMNQRGDWKTFFTEKAAEGIKAVFGMMSDLDLKTSNDPALGVCKNCGCPLSSKVWAPLKHIKANTSPETMEGFPSFCWIKNEA